MLNKYISNKEIDIISFLLENKNNVYNISEIAEGAKVHYETAKYSVRSLVKKDLITKAHKYGKSYLFKLNTSHGLIIDLLNFFDSYEHLNNQKDNNFYEGED